MSESKTAVFLSYTSQDAEAAKRICAALQAGGIEVGQDDGVRRQVEIGVELLAAGFGAKVELAATCIRCQ